MINIAVESITVKKKTVETSSLIAFLSFAPKCLDILIPIPIEIETKIRLNIICISDTSNTIETMLWSILATVRVSKN